MRPSHNLRLCTASKRQDVEAPMCAHTSTFNKRQDVEAPMCAHTSTFNKRQDVEAPMCAHTSTFNKWQDVEAPMCAHTSTFNKRQDVEATMCAHTSTLTEYVRRRIFVSNRPRPWLSFSRSNIQIECIETFIYNIISKTVTNRTNIAILNP